MPTIETYTARNNQRQVQASASDFADTTGTRAMAGALGDIGDTLYKINDEKQRSLATKIASDARIEWEQRLNNSANDPEFSTKYGVDGTGFSKSVISEFSDYQSQVSKQHGKNKYLDNMLIGLREDVAMKSINYQSKFAGNYIRTNYEKSMDNVSKIAKSDPIAAEKELSNLRSAINGSDLIDGTQKNELISKAESDVRIASITGDIERNSSTIKDKIMSNSKKKSLVDRIVGVESGGNATAKNPNSSAFGAGQFINSTWLDLYKEKFGSNGMTDSQILEKRADPKISKQMVSFYADKNKAVLKDFSIKPTDSSLYLAHFLGPRGAVELLTASKDTPVSAILSPKQIEANKSILKDKTVGDVIEWSDKKMGFSSAVDIDRASMEASFPQFASLTLDEQEKVTSFASKYIDSFDAAKRKALLASRELPLEAQLQNENNIMESVIYNDEISIEEKTSILNTSDLKGEIRDEFAVEARRMIESDKEMNAITNQDVMSALVVQMYDLNSISDSNPKDYLTGVNNLRKDIMSKRADGSLHKEDAVKLEGQIKSLMSSKISGATTAISFSFGEARKIIESSLPPQHRGEAIRELFYNTSELAESSSKDKEARKALTLIYKEEALKIIDGINSKGRNQALKNINSFKSGKIETDLEFINSLGQSMDDVNETASIYNMTPEQVIATLRANQGK